MHILGITTQTHDTGVAILRNGSPLGVYEEERFNREKHTLRFPEQSLAAAFAVNGLKLSDIDLITIPWNMRSYRRTVRHILTRRFPHSLNLLRPEARKTIALGAANMPLRVKIGLGRRFGFKNLPRLVQVHHHDAHAAVFFVSPFEEASILIMDGFGDESATSAYTGKGNRIERLWQHAFFDSLGMLYSCVTEHLGFKVFEEGTVMALAACGGPTYLDKFRDVVHLLDGGRIVVNKDYISYDTHGFIRPFTEKFISTFGPARRREEPLTDRHRDLAFALQATVEEAVLHMVRELSRTQPSRNLVISGGVALNCVANARILRDTDYENVWVPPIASDSGVCLGSTLYYHHQVLGHRREYTMRHPFFGMQFTDEQIAKALNDAGLSYTKLPEAELLRRVAKDLADSRIVGWFQGRAEIGPRALGNRSILSDARSLKIKDLINSRIKHREPFRPFAPAVLIERVSDYFEFDQADPFMTMAPKLRPDKISVIPAAAHVDGTGRLQTVERTANPRYYALIEEYARLTGVPVILNTSFNRQEPIVNTPQEAISCYLRTEMDVLVLGDFYVTDRPRQAMEKAQLAFAA